MKYKLIVFWIILMASMAQGQNLEKNTLVTNYQSFGNGYPILIINGGPGMNSNGFASLAKLLSKNNTAIIYDQRGTGGSEIENRDPANFTIDLMVEDIEDLRKQLGYNKWIVMGHSFGGMLAYSYAAKYPDRVKAMIQSHSGGMSLRNVSGYYIRNRLTEIENDSLIYYSSKMELDPGNKDWEINRARFMAKAYLEGSEHEEAIASRLMEVDRELNSIIWANMRSDVFDKTAGMKKFQKEVLILHGLQDVVPIEIAEKAHEVLPYSKLVKMENCGHYGWLDRPDIYLIEVQEFLNENSEDL